MDLRSLLIRELTVIVSELIREGLGGKIPRRNFSKLDQEITLVAQNFRCKRCGRLFLDEHEYHFHHKDGNRSNNNISNCEILCLDCHEKETRRQKRLKNRRFRTA